MTLKYWFYNDMFVCVCVEIFFKIIWLAIWTIKLDTLSEKYIF